VDAKSWSFYTNDLENTTRVGCAIQRSAGRLYVVARYSPPGNFLGRFGTEVAPLKN